MTKIILFYIFVPILDPIAIKLWQKAIANDNQLTGRIIISKHGINGTLGGDIKNLKRYIKENKQYQLFSKIVYKWSDSGSNDFPRLSVKVRPEIVTFGIANELEVDENGVVGGGQHISPKKLHQLVKNKPNEVIFFDGRNKYEALTGHFKDAIIPEINYTREFVSEIESGKYDDIKNKPVVTYCTGGIRCEVLTMIMKKNGFSEVYQIDGGIHNYGKTYQDSGMWEGSLYTFDGRKGMKFSNQAKDIGQCLNCSIKTSNYENCSNKVCNKLIVICSDCANQSLFCSKKCSDITIKNK